MSVKGDVIIEVKNLEKHFHGGEIKALDGINTVIRKGEVVVIIGPSGSGKSTFLRSLNLLEIPTGGSILFEGEDITDPQVQHKYAPQEDGHGFPALQPVPQHDDTEKPDHCADEALRQEP